MNDFRVKQTEKLKHAVKLNRRFQRTSATLGPGILTLNITLHVSLSRNKDHHPDQPETSHEPQSVRDCPAQAPGGLRDPAWSPPDIPTTAEKTTRGGGAGESRENQA